jgi:senataxin
MVPSSGEWYVQKLGNMVTINREFQALYAMQELALCDSLLSPGPSREMMPPAASLLPAEALIKVIEEHFDPSQLRAIRMTLTGRGVTLIQGPPGTGKTKTILGILSVLLNTHDPRPTKMQDKKEIQPALPAAAEPVDVPRLLSAAAPWLRSGYSDVDAPEQIYLSPCVPAAATAFYPKAGSTDRWMSLGRAVPEAPPRHVMVCAPSNAAIDEIVSRILAGGDESVMGMRNAAGKPWIPKLVRVGPNVKEALLPVSLDAVAKSHMMKKEGLTYDAAKIEVLRKYIGQNPPCFVLVLDSFM